MPLIITRTGSREEGSRYLEDLFDIFRKSLADIVCHKELIECLKGLMNSNTGLDAVLNKEGSIRGIFVNLYSKNSVMKTQLLKLLAALTLCSKQGYK
jgi:hypothetical protein